MAFNAQNIGRASGENVTSLIIPTPRVSAGSKIFVAVAIDKVGFDNLVDSAGNTYDQVAGSQSGIGAFFFECPNSLLLPNNSQIELQSSGPLSGSIAAFSADGLTAGNLIASFAGQGDSDSPAVGFGSPVAGNWCVAVLAADGPSSDGFTQDPAWQDPPGGFNTQTTNAFSAYGAVRQAPGGRVLWQPHIGQPRIWAALGIVLTA